MFARGLAPTLALASAALLFGCSDEPTTPDAQPAADATVGDAQGIPDATADDAQVAPDAAGPDATLDGGVAPDAQPDGGGGAPRSIVFVHTNDEHSHELGFAPEVDDVPTAAVGEGIGGGVLRRSVVIDRIKAAARATGASTALVSAGDQTMGSMFHLANPSAGVDYAIATLLGYDVMTLGNHEFDFGAGQLAGALRAGGIDPFGMPGIVQIPIVVSNIRFSTSSVDDDTLASLYSRAGDATHPLRRTTIKTHGGVRVGYLGLMGIEASYFAPFKRPVRFSIATNNTACTTDADCAGTFCVPSAADPTAAMGQCAVTNDESDARNFAALVGDAAAAVAELRAQNVDLVVALSHVGVDERELAMLAAMNMPASEARTSEEILLAKAVNQALGAQNLHGIDVIIGGHSHTALMRPIAIPNVPQGAQTFIVQAGANGGYVGKLRLTKENDAAPWLLDEAFSGLEAVDDTVDANMASAFFGMLVRPSIERVVQGLESTPIALAGDGVIFPGEQCDGTALPNRGQCAGLIGPATGGTLSCYANRQLNTSACTFPAASCGNGTIDVGEECDGAALGVADCAGLYYASGALGCHANCTYDRSSCVQDFPSLLEVVVNFAQSGPPVRDQQGPYDLFFATLGFTSFDIPEASPNRESNLLNLVTDAERAVANQLVHSDDPIRIVINANGVIRDGIYQGETGVLTPEDLFRVLPLGISPVEKTPAYTMVDFWMRADEVVRGLEIGVSRGAVSDAFWLGVSGARVTYDPSRPAGDRIMSVQLLDPSANPEDDGALEKAAPLYDRDNGGYPDAARLVHVGTSFYIGLFLENLGFCPREADGTEVPHCRACTAANQCTVQGSTCDTALGRCVGPTPAAVATRTLMPVTFQELKEFLTLTTYVRRFKGLPNNYAQPTPRRMCCVGAACPADGSLSCD